MKEIKEIEAPGAEIISLDFKTPKEAAEAYLSLPQSLKADMAEIYRAAFGGAPWYEKYKCEGTPECGFLQEPFCPVCKNDKAVSEAYPKDWLINTYFGEMLTDFIPGILGILKQDERAVGFTTGGFCRLNELVFKKYGTKAQKIRDSITSRLALEAESVVFYDNETCILPEKQGQGLGPKLSEYRIGQSLALGAELICGRTINHTWLATKGEQFKRRGLEFNFFVPDGDTYEVNGNPRYFYLARVLK